MNAAPPAIVAERLTRIYRATRRSPARTALDGVSLRIDDGAFVALLGPNGSGKSTLLRILATLDAPTTGSLALLGREHAVGARGDLGVVFQHEALDRLLTGRENLRVQARLFGMSSRDADHSIRRVADDLGVTDRLDDRVSTLSGGLRRRIDLARALLAEPRLLLLDEPTTGLDHAARAAFLDTLDRVRRSAAMTVVLSTHLMDEAERADRVVMLADGKVVADGAPGALCAELGAALVRTADDEADALRAMGLEARRVYADTVAAGNAETLARAAHDLASRGVPYTFGPPTLGDVYLARTGQALATAREPSP